MAKLLDIKVYPYRGETIRLYRALKLAHNSIMGAFTCLRQDNIGPRRGVPKTHIVGWNFVVWNAFSQRAKLRSNNDLLRITRQTTLSQEETAWSQSGTFTSLVRVEAILRVISKYRFFTDRLVAPVHFFKSEGYAQNKVIGKKPKGGIFTNDEVATLRRDWEVRKERVHLFYERTISDWELIDLDSRGLRAVISALYPNKDGAVKQIEEYSRKRIPQLLVASGRGRNAQKNIAAGSTLVDKLQNVQGGPSIRSPAIVMYSPLYGGTSELFINSSLNLTRAIMRTPGEGDMQEKFDQMCNNSNDLNSQSLNFKEGVKAMYYIYNDLMQYRYGDASWNSFFVPQQAQ
jgi:hypothetical protein